MMVSNGIHHRGDFHTNLDTETGGFGDHVVPFHSHAGTAGEWMLDPYGKFGQVYTGPGFRLPFYIVSPWTRGGHVFVENADHISQIKFIEQWLAAKGVNVTSNQIPAWRRTHMSDLTKAFDFTNPDYSLPTIPDISAPSTDAKGNYDGYALCEATYPTQRPPVPYGEQTAESSLISESGYKCVRGDLTEGRYLVFEMNGYALTTGGSVLSASTATSQHDSVTQRWMAHQLVLGGNEFTLSSAVDGKYIVANLEFLELSSEAKDAVAFTVRDLGNGKGHTLQTANGFISIQTNYTAGTISWSKDPVGFAVFSVTYG
jgi:phospholipase C